VTSFKLIFTLVFIYAHAFRFCNIYYPSGEATRY